MDSNGAYKKVLLDQILRDFERNQNDTCDTFVQSFSCSVDLGKIKCSSGHLDRVYCTVW